MSEENSGVTCNLQLYKMLTDKSAAKLEVFERLKETFSLWKKVLNQITNELSSDVCGKNEKIEISIQDSSDFEVKFKAAGDLLYSYIHSNVFALDEQHFVQQHSHFRKNPNNAYFGVLHLYYFLKDSLLYNRMSDNGILIARILVNQNANFFVEGVKPFGDYERFDEKRVLDETMLKEIAEKAIFYMLEIDLTLPPKNHAQLMSVADVQNVRQNMRFQTKQALGFIKRLG
jgi:hypothetical protein